MRQMKLSLHIKQKKQSIHVLFFHSFFQQPPNINTGLVSGAPVKGNADFTVQATQVAHTPKAPNNIASNKNQVHHINQPRK